VRLRLILEYLTISPSSESLFSTLIHFPSSRSILKLKWESLLHIDTLSLEWKHSQTQIHYSWPVTYNTVYTFIWDTLVWNLRKKDFQYEVKMIKQSFSVPYELEQSSSVPYELVLSLELRVDKVWYVQVFNFLMIYFNLIIMWNACIFL